MKTDIISDLESFDRFLPEWRDFLARPVVGSNVGNDPANVRFAMAGEAWGKPLLVVVREASGAPCCIAPLYIQRSRFKLQVSVRSLGSLPIRMLKAFGDRFIYRESCDPRGCFDAVFAVVTERCKDFDAIYFHSLDCEGELWKYLVEQGGPRAGRPPFAVIASQTGVVHRIIMPATHEEYLASLGSKTRQNLRRTTKRLFGDGRATLEKFTGPGDVRAFLAKLDAICQRTWQAKTFGYRPRNIEPCCRSFEHVAENGWMRSYILVCDGQPIAYELGYQHHGTYYGQECGFDQQWAEFGPGSILIHLVIEDLFREDRPEVLDFGFGDAAYKRSFGNVCYEATDLYLARSRPWRWILRSQRGLDAMSTASRVALVKMRIDRPVRRLLKHMNRS